MRSLYFRVFLITIYTIAVSSLLGFYISNVYYHWQLKPYNDKKLVQVAQNIRLHVELYPDFMEAYLHNAASLGYQLYLVDEQHNGSFYGAAFRDIRLDAGAERAVLAGGTYHGVGDYPSKPFVTGYFENSLRNSVGVPVKAGDTRYALFLRPDIKLQFGELRIFFAMIVVLTILFSIPYFLLSTRYLVQPISRLTEATKRIKQGNYDVMLPTRRKDEIGQLATHFQVMSRELERVDKAQKEFVANVSHEIQSPLASIQGFADTLQSKELSEGERQRYAAIISEEARHLAALSRQLLLLSKLDNANDAVACRLYKLKPQLRQVVQLMEWQLTEKEIAVRIAVPEQLQAYGDEVLLLQVWTNLISNAVKHIPAGRSVTINAYCDDTACSVTVADTGDGIPDEQLPHIFDRFYRGDSARERASGSTGLGLSIVRKIIRLHGGTITVYSQLGEGTSFIVVLPHSPST